MVLDSPRLEKQSAGYRVGTHRDILTIIALHLDRSTRITCLTTSTRFYLTVLPHIYHTIDFGYKFVRKENEEERESRKLKDRYDRDESEEFDIKRYVNPFLGTDIEDDSPFTKRAALRYVKIINLFEHDTEMCSALPRLPALRRLEVLHLAGGGRPQGNDTHPCHSKDCRILSDTCKHAKTAVIRSYGRKSQAQLPPLASLQKVILKLRPCQLPIQEGSGSVYLDINNLRLTYGDHNPFGTLSSVADLELIFWDEAHRHRVDFTHWVGYDPGWRYGRGGHGGPKKDCEYCNQRSCVEYTQYGPDDLSDLVAMVGRWTNVKRMKIFNIERSVRKGESDYPGRGPMTVKEVECRMLVAFRQGRKDSSARSKAGSKVIGKAKVGGEAGEEGKVGCKITFHTAGEYFNIARLDPAQAADPREMEYWNLLCNPTEKTISLRNRLLRYPNTGFTPRDLDYLDDRRLEHCLKARADEEAQRLARTLARDRAERSDSTSGSPRIRESYAERMDERRRTRRRSRAGRSDPISR